MEVCDGRYLIFGIAHQDMKLQITLSDYIQQVGYQTVRKMTGASESTVKAWRYFNRVPRVKQAKKLILHSHGFTELGVNLWIDRRYGHRPRIQHRPF